MKQRAYSIDFLKFILAIVIIFHHYQYLTGARFEGFNFYDGRVSFSYVVEFFFVLSGYVCAMSAGSLLKKSFGQYLLGKIKRLYPMVAITVVVNYLLEYWFKSIYGYWNNEPGLWKLLNSLTLTYHGWGTTDIGLGFNNPTWYLCVLMLCYIVLYFITWIADRNNIDVRILAGVVMLIGTGAVSYGVALPYLNAQSARGYASFFLGYLLYHLYGRLKGSKPAIALACVVVLAVAFGGLKDPDLYWDNWWGICTFMLIPAIVYLFLQVDGLFKPAIFRFLGDVSFEMYLWHVAGITLLLILDYYVGFTMAFSRKEMCLFTLAVIAFSCLMYQFVEKNIQRLLKK